MIHVKSDSKYDYFTHKFQGINMRLQKDKLTHQYLINSDDVAKLLGFENSKKMLDKNPQAMDVFLDGVNSKK